MAIDYGLVQHCCGAARKEVALKSFLAYSLIGSLALHIGVLTSALATFEQSA